MSADADRARAALFAIPPGLSRDEWHEIGRAAIAAGLTVDDVNTWSEPADNYKGRPDVESAFRTIKPNGKTTAGTLFHHAKLHGWIDAERPHNGAKRAAAAAPKAEGKAHNPAATWDACAPATAAHDYIDRKLGLPDGVRVYSGTLTIAGQPVDGALVLPARTLAGELCTLQFIPTEGKKLFLPGVRLAPDACLIVGGTLDKAERIFVCEGIGQAWSAHQATRAPAVVTFGAGRMAGVSKALREKYPSALLVLVADRGKETQCAAIAADVRGQFVELPDDKPKNYDLNDYHRDLRDLRAVAELLEHPKVPPACADAEAREWPAALDLAALAEREPELPRFIISDWLPAGYATLLAGHGGVGKSAIALYLAVCIAAGVPFFGLQVARRRVLYLSCEDREAVLHWRLSRICAHLGVNLASLRGWLEIIDLVGADAILWERDPRTSNAITSAYGRLQDRMSEHQTEVLMIDGISDSFAGNENARTEVKRYVNGLVALIPPDTGAVLLVGHVAKLGSTAGANGDGYSGSTGWHNSVRARWYLYPEATESEDGERNERTGDLILDLQKSNMGRTEQSIRFAWDADAHLFLGREIVGATQFDRLHRDRIERKGILAALKACAASNPPIIVPAAMQGPRTAFHVLAQRAELPDTLRSGKPAKRRFWRQIESLRQIHAIAEAQYKRTDRHFAAQLTITTEGMRECGE